MDYSEIKNLLDHGFTRDDVMNIINGGNTPPAKEPETPPAKEPETPPAKEPETPPAKEPETPPAKEPETPPVNPLEKRIDGIEALIKGMIADMQEHNILSDSINRLPADSTEVVDSIMATIIRPERKDKK